MQPSTNLLPLSIRAFRLHPATSEPPLSSGDRLQVTMTIEVGEVKGDRSRRYRAAHTELLDDVQRLDDDQWW